jgi:hypothetical protein
VKGGGTLKTQPDFRSGPIAQLFTRSKIRRRMSAGLFAIILPPLAEALISRGYTFGSVRTFLRSAEHFGRWLTDQDSQAEVL